MTDRYKELFEQSADAILIIDEDKFVDCNNATVKMLRAENKQQVLDTHPSELSPDKQPDGRLSYEKANDMIETALREGSNRFEWHHKRIDGEVFPVEVLLTPIHEDEKVILHVVWRDISERKKTEKELKDNLELLNSIFDNQPTCVEIVNKDGILLDINPAGLKMLGVANKKEVVNKELFTIIDESDRERFFRYTRGICEGGRGRLKFKIFDINKNIHIMNSVSVPLHYGAHNEIVMLSITRDITEEIKEQEEKALLQEELNQAQKLDAVGQLAGGIAHDLNNMLCGILGACDLINNQIDKKGNNDLTRKYLRMIIDAAERSTDLTKNLLSFARKVEIQEKPLELHEAILGATEILKRTLNKKVRVITELNSESSIVKGDMSQLQSVFMNLGINAGYAMPTGGELTINTKNCVLDESFCNESLFNISPGNYIHVKVKDTGCGMNKKTLDKVFEPFFTTKPQGKGTGLGLPAVYGTVCNHNGLISVSSELDIGTEFDIFLPVCTKKPVVKKLVSEVIKGNGCILIVDDEDAVRTTATLILEKLGYEVISAKNGKEGVDLFREKHEEIDLVFLDMMMPEMSGTESFDAMKKIDPDVKVVIASGFSQNNEVDRLLKEGLVEFINKPYRMSSLSQILHRELNINDNAD